jgi:hypothetical protein
MTWFAMSMHEITAGERAQALVVVRRQLAKSLELSSVRRERLEKALDAAGIDHQSPWSAT